MILVVRVQLLPFSYFACCPAVATMWVDIPSRRETLVRSVVQARVGVTTDFVAKVREIAAESITFFTM